jgi:hypothetical protein
MESLKTLLCALRGHDELLRFEKNRVYLQCMTCGHQSPGWTVEARRPVLRFESRRGKTPTPTLARKTA